jgi:hypothetical protein
LQPPIKRATLNADTLFQGRGTSNAIPLWKSVKGTRKIEHKLNIRKLKIARSEVDLLSLIEQFPGQTANFYASRLPGRSAEWVRITLNQYAADGLVRNVRAKKATYLWYLNE